MKALSKADSRESPVQEKTIVGVAFVVLIFLMPFSIYHFYLERYVLGIGSLTIVILMAINAWNCWRGRYYPLWIFFSLAPISAIFLGLTIYQHDVMGLLWCYPAVICFYFMLPQHYAWGANAALLLMALPMSWQFLDMDLAVGATATLLCVSAFSMIFVRVIHAQQHKLHELAMTDSLTGLANRVQLHQSLEQAVRLHERRRMPMTLIALDLDNFKRINDTLGHDAGDDVLRGIGDLLKKRIRRSDKVFRLGGEEFLILLYDTDLDKGWLVAEEVRKAIEAMPLLPNRHVTTSLGIATLQPKEYWGDWMKRSDDNLYRAKKAGRNRAVA